MNFSCLPRDIVSSFADIHFNFRWNEFQPTEDDQCHPYSITVTILVCFELWPSNGENNADNDRLLIRFFFYKIDFDSNRKFNFYLNFLYFYLCMTIYEYSSPLFDIMVDSTRLELIFLNLTKFVLIWNVEKQWK